MSFVSIEYGLFFAIIFFLYFSLAHRFRWILLLIGSYIFYIVGNGEFILLIFFSTLSDYFIAKRIFKTESQRRRKLLLALSITLNLGVLFFFKYFNFFNQSAEQFLGIFGIAYSAQTLNVILPVGISFYTFQEMAYTIDVYRGKIAPENRFYILATYIAFFPQLVAGPIERAENILPQFDKKFDFDYDRIVEGLRLVVWGLFKKVVIADRLAIYVNEVYKRPEEYEGITLITATIFFGIQIYCDFSGYSDIAIGTAKVLGIRLMQNFRQPYFAQSISEFWQRWHISLSTWFRDYVYIPLGGNRVPLLRHLANLMIVFIVSGLWHGASWTFVIWGGLHGILIVLETILRRLMERFDFDLNIPSPIKVIFTLSVTMFAWIFFRANTTADATYIVRHLFDFATGFANIAEPFGEAVFGAHKEFRFSIALIIILFVVDWIDAAFGLLTSFQRLPGIVRWGMYYVSAAAIGLAILYGATTQEFIYFQF